MPPTNDPVAAEIEAEIADHLATSAGELEAAGVARHDARQKAQEKFGDAAAIGRRCYWIKQGDSLMFRAAVVCLLVALCIGLAITTIGSWQAQSRMAQQMNALTGQLKAMAESQESPPTTQPLEITGKLYVGSPDKPAANHEVTIVNVKDGSIVRRVLSNDQGEYRSGPLADGDYSLVCKLEAKTLPPYPRLQTEPIYVYPGVRAASRDIDVASPAGRLAIETSRPLPRQIVDDKYVIDSRLFVEVAAPQMQRFLWISRNEVPAAWPMYIEFVGSGGELRGGRADYQFYELLSNADLGDDAAQTLFNHQPGLVLGDNVTVRAVLLADVLPLHVEWPTIKVRNMSRYGVGSAANDGISRELLNQWRNVAQDFRGRPGSEAAGPRSLDQAVLSTEDDDFVWITKGLGKRWLEHLGNGESAALAPQPHFMSPDWLAGRAAAFTAPLKAGNTTRLKVTIPDDLESRVKSLVDSASDAETFVKHTLSGQYDQQSQDESPLLRRVEIAVVGTEPIAENERAAGDSSQ